MKMSQPSGVSLFDCCDLGEGDTTYSQEVSHDWDRAEGGTMFMFERKTLWLSDMR